MENLSKTLKEIFTEAYVVPLYQRNFAWREEEISLLLQDLYESFTKRPEQHYFIGTLVVLRRRDGRFEIIDGQQRLTTLSLLLRLLGLIERPVLSYESRPDVEGFLGRFYYNGTASVLAGETSTVHLEEAVTILQDTRLNPDNLDFTLTIRNFPESEKEDFKRFLWERVILVRVEMPEDTDVAAYFEVMNNRGEQLQKHEILKSYLLEKLKDAEGHYLKAAQETFAFIWDACSQMNTHIQKLFPPDLRKEYFGENFDGFNPFIGFDKALSMPGFSVSIEEALVEKVSEQGAVNSKNELTDIVADEEDYQSIIDFPNFLMHVFRLKYGTYKEGDKEVDIPLNEKDLLSVYEGVKERVEAQDFIKDLLYYRTVFDRYVPKASQDEKDEEHYIWTLKRPNRPAEDRNILTYRNTFDSQDRILKLLSMLQVTFRTRKYKNWLQEALSFFKDQNLHKTEDQYRKTLEAYVFKYFRENIRNEHYHAGTATPHFLLNFIDYLYSVKEKHSFQFRYRNSVEHHLPQSSVDNNALDEERRKERAANVHSIGNLCLVSSSVNSRMNNEDPLGKAREGGKFYRNDLPPKQKVMYDLTNKRNCWEAREILDHSKDIQDLIAEREAILAAHEPA
jgi:hypothetical protein